LSGCTSIVPQANLSDAIQAGGEPETTEPITEAPTEPPVVDKLVRVIAVGDNLVQTGVYNEAERYKGEYDEYNFKPLYEGVKDIVKLGDISIINQETLIANGKFPVSGTNYHFNSPIELGRDMIDLGFNVFTVANNHLLDLRIEGLEASLDYWDSMVNLHGVKVVGAYRNDEDMANIRTMEINGVTVAFLAYTEHLNGYKLPSSSNVKVIWTSEKTVMESQIRQAKSIADAVIVSVHWGAEDTHTVTQERKDLAKEMIDWGCDVIIGTHPHTAQTMEYIERGDGTRGFVYYSLGNFISAQTDNFNLIGEIADFTIKVDGYTGAVSVVDVGAIPVITHYDNGRFANMRLIPYWDYTGELASSHGVPYAPYGTAKDFSMKVVDRIVNNNIPEEFRILTKPFAGTAGNLIAEDDFY